MEDDNNAMYQKPTRPTLITVLTILTLVGSGIGIILDSAYLIGQNMGRSTIEYPIWLPVLGILFSAGKIVAAVLMAKMRKIGFFIYLPLEAGIACLSILSGRIQMDYMDSSFVNPDMPFDINIITIVTTGLWVLASIGFLIGYATQLGKME